jgi:hypothetical protein
VTPFERAQRDEARARYNLETLFGTDPPDWPAVIARERWPAGLEEALRRLELLHDGAPIEHPVCGRCWRHCHVEARAVEHADGRALLVGACDEGEVGGLLTFDQANRATVRIHPRMLAHRIAEGLGLVGVMDEVLRGRVWRLGYRSLAGARRVVFLARGEFDPGAVDEAGAVVLTPEPVAWAAADAVVLSLRAVMDVHETFAVDVEGLEGALGRKRRKLVEPIRVAMGLDWRRITVRVVDDATIEVVAPGVRERRTFAECGLGDARKGDREPTRAWAFLLLLARNGGSLQTGDAGSGDDERKAAQALREAMRRLFAPEPTGNPVLPWTGAEGWRAGFLLVDARPRR